MPIPGAKSAPAARPLGDPNLAVLFTWLVPGGGHLYLGRTRFALAAFAVVQALYALGVWLSSGMFLEYLPPEMRSRFAPALTPEVGNLGALLLHVKHFGYGESFPRRWPPGMDAGTTLTALSGVINLFVMSRAHLDARLPERPREWRRDPSFAAFATFLVPGLGQFLQGRRARGAVMFVLLVGLFALGCWLAAGANLDRERHFYYWAGQFLLGLPAIAIEFAHGHPLVTADIPYADAGVVLACVAGMLNVLNMLDAFAWGEERLTGVPRHPAREAAQAPEARRAPGTEEAPEPGKAKESELEAPA